MSMQCIREGGRIAAWETINEQCPFGVDSYIIFEWTIRTPKIYRENMFNWSTFIIAICLQQLYINFICVNLHINCGNDKMNIQEFQAVPSVYAIFLCENFQYPAEKYSPKIDTICSDQLHEKKVHNYVEYFWPTKNDRVHSTYKCSKRVSNIFKIPCEKKLPSPFIEHLSRGKWRSAASARAQNNNNEYALFMRIIIHF